MSEAASGSSGGYSSGFPASPRENLEPGMLLLLGDGINRSFVALAARLLRPVTQQGIAQGRRWGKFWVSQETQRLLTVSLQSGARSAAGSGAQRTALRGALLCSLRPEPASHPQLDGKAVSSLRAAGIAQFDAFSMLEQYPVSWGPKP